MSLCLSLDSASTALDATYLRPIFTAISASLTSVLLHAISIFLTFSALTSQMTVDAGICYLDQIALPLLRTTWLIKTKRIRTKINA